MGEQIALFEEPRSKRCTEPCTTPLCWACLPTVQSWSAWEIEYWMPVPTFEGAFEVSSFGVVRGLDRVVRYNDGNRFSQARKRLVRGQVLNPSPDSHGYPVVHVGQRVRVHGLETLAFFGPRPDGLEVCHWDDSPSDNRLFQLRYDTKGGNQRDQVRNGRHHYANKTHCPQGHPYDEENTIIGRRGDGSTFRMCKICQYARSREAKRQARQRKRAG
jgi:hypothetical protein